MSRPKLPDSERRRHRVPVYLNDAEIAALHRLAEREERPPAEVLRRLIRKATKSPD